MKKLLIILATALTGLVMIPTTAQAQRYGCNNGHSYTYVSGHTACGCAIYTKRVLVRYDCHGHPVYRYYRQPITHRCGSYGKNTYRRSHHSVNRGCGTNYRSSSRYHRGGSRFTIRTSNGCFSFGR